MQKHMTAWSFLLAMIFINQGFAQSAFNIDEAVDYALKNHASIKNAKVGQQDAELQIKEIKYAGLPQINGSFQFSTNLLIPTQIIEAKNFNPAAKDGEIAKIKFGVPWGGQAGIGVNQLLFDASWLVGLRAAETYRLMASQEMDKSKVTIAETVRKAYYTAMVTEQRAGLLTLNLARMDSAIFTTEQYFKQGFVEKIDIDRLKVQRNNLTAEKQKLDNLIALTLQLLKFQMSYPQEAVLTLTEKLNTENILALRYVLENDVNPDNRIEYKQLQTSKVLTSLNIERIDKTKYPSVALSGSLGAGHSNLRFNPFERWFGSSVLGLNVRIPIYDSGLRRVQMERQKLNLIKIDNGADLLKESFKLENNSAKINFKNGFESLEIQQRNMELASEVLRVSKIKFQQGVGSSLEVVNAESDLKTSQNNYFSALFDVLIAKVDLDKAQGKLFKN